MSLIPAPTYATKAQILANANGRISRLKLDAAIRNGLVRTVEVGVSGRLKVNVADVEKLIRDSQSPAEAA
jgi:hypothetical protein